MPSYRISTAARLLGVSDDTLRRRVGANAIDLATDRAGFSVIDGVDLVRLAQGEAPAGEGESVTSARNHFEGLVTKVVSDQVMSQVELQCGPYRVVALISTESVRELGLEVCVASGSLLAAIGTKLGRTGLDGHFPEAVRFSAEQVEHGKPAPVVFLLAARELGFAPERCVVVEDSRAGIEAAVAAGMPVVGYRSDLTPTGWLEGADAVIDEMADLPSVISRLTALG